MVKINIISTCNNNCKYCFQQDGYHQKNLMLTLDEIRDILEWSKGRHDIGILGGEPTLHPDIIEIVKMTQQTAQRVILLTNLLGKTEIIDKLSDIAPKASWLINTTTRDELKDLFETNIDILYKKRIKVGLGITFMLDEEYDERSMVNLVRLGKKYPEIVDCYRIGLATPFHKEKIELKNYDETLEKFCKLYLKETPDIRPHFDCQINMCQVSSNMVGKLIEEYKFQKVVINDICGPIFDVMADKSIKYCASMPDDFTVIDSYKRFKDWRECQQYLLNLKKEYMKNNQHICKSIKTCNTPMCQGTCMAISEYIKRQNSLIGATHG